MGWGLGFRVVAAGTSKDGVPSKVTFVAATLEELVERVIGDDLQITELLVDGPAAFGHLYFTLSKVHLDDRLQELFEQEGSVTFEHLLKRQSPESSPTIKVMYQAFKAEVLAKIENLKRRKNIRVRLFWDDKSFRALAKLGTSLKRKRDRERDERHFCRAASIVKRMQERQVKAAPKVDDQGFTKYTRRQRKGNTRGYERDALNTLRRLAYIAFSNPLVGGLIETEPLKEDLSGLERPEQLSERLADRYFLDRYAKTRTLFDAQEQVVHILSDSESDLSIAAYCQIATRVLNQAPDSRVVWTSDSDLLANPHSTALRYLVRYHKPFYKDGSDQSAKAWQLIDKKRFEAAVDLPVSTKGALLNLSVIVGNDYVPGGFKQVGVGRLRSFKKSNPLEKPLKEAIDQLAGREYKSSFAPSELAAYRDEDAPEAYSALFWCQHVPVPTEEEMEDASAEEEVVLAEEPAIDQPSPEDLEDDDYKEEEEELPLPKPKNKALSKRQVIARRQQRKHEALIEAQRKRFVVEFQNDIYLEKLGHGDIEFKNGSNSQGQASKLKDGQSRPARVPTNEADVTFHKEVISKQTARQPRIMSSKDLKPADLFKEKEEQRLPEDSVKGVKNPGQGKKTAAKPTRAKMPKLAVPSLASIMAELNGHFEEEAEQQAGDGTGDDSEGEDDGEGKAESKKTKRKKGKNKPEEPKKKASSKPLASVGAPRTVSRTMGGILNKLCADHATAKENPIDPLLKLAVVRHLLELQTAGPAVTTFFNLLYTTRFPRDLALIEQASYLKNTICSLLRLLVEQDGSSWYLSRTLEQQIAYRKSLARTLAEASLPADSSTEEIRNRSDVIVGILSSIHPQVIAASVKTKAGKPWENLLLQSLLAAHYALKTLALPHICPSETLVVEWDAFLTDAAAAARTNPKEDCIRLLHLEANEAASSLDYSLLLRGKRNAVREAIKTLIAVTILEQSFAAALPTKAWLERQLASTLVSLSQQKHEESDHILEDDTEDEDGDETPASVEISWMPDSFAEAALSKLNEVLSYRNQNCAFVHRAVSDGKLTAAEATLKNALMSKLARKGKVTVYSCYPYLYDIKRRLQNQELASEFVDAQWVEFSAQKSFYWLFKAESNIDSTIAWLNKHILPSAHSTIKRLLQEGLLQHTDRPRQRNPFGLLDELDIFVHNKTAARNTKSLGNFLRQADQYSCRTLEKSEVYMQSLETYQDRIAGFLQLNGHATGQWRKKGYTDHLKKWEQNRICVANLLFNLESFPLYEIPTLTFSCDGFVIHANTINFSKGSWNEEFRKEAGDSATDIAKYLNKALKASHASFDEGFAKRCNLGNSFAQTDVKSRPSNRHNASRESLLLSPVIRPIFPNDNYEGDSRVSVADAHFKRLQRTFKPFYKGRLKTRNGMYRDILKCNSEGVVRLKAWIGYCQQNPKTNPDISLNDLILKGYEKKADLSKVNLFATDQGFTFTNAITGRVRPKLPEEPPQDKKKDPVAKLVRLLHKPTGMQEITKMHSRAVQKERDGFAIDINKTARLAAKDSSLLPAYRLLLVIFRTSYGVRHQDWLRFTRVQSSLDRLVDQFLETSGLRPDRLFNPAEPYKGPLGNQKEHRKSSHTISNFLASSQVTVLALGDACRPASESGIKTHTADYRNDPIRRLIRRCRDEFLPLKVCFVREAWSSQVCQDPTCKKIVESQDKDGNTYTREIRCCAMTPSWQDRGNDMLRLLRCEKCHKTTNRDSGAAYSIIFNLWHLLEFGEEAFYKEQKKSSSNTTTRGARQEAAVAHGAY